VNVTGWSRGLEVTADGEGVVSHAGLALLRGLADKTGLTAGLSRALAGAGVLVHDRGRVAADVACAIADGRGRIGEAAGDEVYGRAGELRKFLQDNEIGMCCGWDAPSTSRWRPG
jgi:hypothetical protein